MKNYLHDQVVIKPNIGFLLCYIHLQVKLSSCQRIVLLNYNKDTKLIDFRHYSIRLQPVGVSRRIRKFVQNHQVPNLKDLQDVSDFVTKYDSLSPHTHKKKIYLKT